MLKEIGNMIICGSQCFEMYNISVSTWLPEKQTTFWSVWHISGQRSLFFFFRFLSIACWKSLYCCSVVEDKSNEIKWFGIKNYIIIFKYNCIKHAYLLKKLLKHICGHMFNIMIRILILSEYWQILIWNRK